MCIPRRVRLARRAKAQARRRGRLARRTEPLSTGGWYYRKVELPYEPTIDRGPAAEGNTDSLARRAA
jgi:hypothetical protein